MNCEKIKKLLSKYFDNQLQPHQKEDIFKHMKSCPLCEEEFNLLFTIYQNLPQYEDVDISVNFNTKLFRRLSQEEQAKNRFSIVANILWNLNLRKFLVSAVSIFLIIFGVMFVSHYNKDLNKYSLLYELYPQEDIDLAMMDFYIDYLN